MFQDLGNTQLVTVQTYLTHPSQRTELVSSFNLLHKITDQQHREGQRLNHKQPEARVLDLLSSLTLRKEDSKKEDRPLIFINMEPQNK